MKRPALGPPIWILAALAALLSCRGDPDSVVLVTVKAAPGLPPVTQIRATFVNGSAVDTSYFPQTRSADAISFDATFSVTFSRAREGELEIVLDGFGATGSQPIAHGTSGVAIVPGGTATVTITLEGNPPPCGNGQLDSGEECDYGNPPPGIECDLGCKILRRPDGGAGAGGAGGAGVRGSGGAGSGGRTGAGGTGMAGRSGSGGAGGAIGSGGAGTGGAGSGGSPGSGGAGTGGAGTGGRFGTGGAGTGGAGTGGRLGTGGAGTGGRPGTGGAGTGGAGTGGAGTGGALTAGLVLYYPFNESAGPTVADLSGRGSSGTVVGSAASFGPGMVGNAISLNQVSIGTNYVSVPAGILSTATDLTISAWVRTSATAGGDGGASTRTWQRVLDFGNSTTVYMYLTTSTGSSPGPAGVVRFVITTSSVNGEQRIDGPMFSTGIWTHLAVVLGPAGAVLYVNGAAASTNAQLTLRPRDLGATANNWLGRSQFAVDPFFAGSLDELRLYDRALSAAEISSLYQLR